MIDGTTWNCAAELASPSVALSSTAPATASGTDPAQENAPSFPDIAVQSTVVSHVTVTVDFAPNPVPETVSALPTVPLVLETDSDETTVSPTDAPTALTQCVPDVHVGIPNSHVNDPTLVVVALQSPPVGPVT